MVEILKVPRKRGQVRTKKGKTESSGGSVLETEHTTEPETAPPEALLHPNEPFANAISEENPKDLSYRKKFQKDKFREMIISDIAQDIHDRRRDANKARWLREYNLPLDPDQVHQTLIDNEHDPDTDGATKFMEKWDWDQAVQIYERKYGRETPSAASVVTEPEPEPEPEVEVASASKPSLAISETPSAAEPATPTAPKSVEVMQSAEAFTPEQNKVLLKMISVASNLFKVWYGESEQQKSGIGDDEARKKIVLDRIKEEISDLINKDSVTKKIFTEEKFPEAIDHVMKFTEKFNSPKKYVEVPEITIETADQPLIYDKDELIRKKSAGPGKERKDLEQTRRLYESLAQKARIAEIEAKIPKEASKGQEVLWEIQKSALKGLKQTLGKMVKSFSASEVAVIRDEFLGNFLDIYREMRKEKEKKGKMNPTELRMFKDEVTSQMEESLRDRYGEDEQSVKLIMGYFWNMFNVEYLLDDSK